MTLIRLYNTKARAKQDFRPLDAANVRMYVCGPTVYDRAHLGNARPVVVFDVLYRLLRHVYGAQHVTYVRNITDVDDKIIARAAERGIKIDELTTTTTDWFHEDMAQLGVDYSDANQHPNFHEPKATEYIDQMRTMIEALAEKDFAYEAEGHVLFRVRKYEEYGALSGRSVDDMISGARVEVAAYKEDPLDFVLWKPSTPDMPGWKGPMVNGVRVGRGRPGWHIECSAMSYELLGAAFDIHGGGNDLMFPHHENEIAQSACVHPEAGFANFWMHNEMLQVEGKKMSKSLGNFFTVRDLLEQGVPGEVIRFVMLSTHYRKPMDWTDRKVAEAEATLRRWRTFTENVDAGTLSDDVITALKDDLNVPAAMALLRNLFTVGDFATLKSSAQLFGLLGHNLSDWAWKQETVQVHGYGIVSQAGATAELTNAHALKILNLLAIRRSAKSDGDYERADQIRRDLDAAGIVLEDTKDGDTGWKVSPLCTLKKLEALK